MRLSYPAIRHNLTTRLETSTRIFPRGFSLLEVIVALAFISLALVAVIRLQGQGLRLAAEARFRSQAIFLAGSALAEAQASGDLTPGTRDGDFPEPVQGFKWHREVSPVPGFPGLFKVQVEVRQSSQPTAPGLTLIGFAYREGM